jgi:CRP-like cAMP-binding protein
VRQGDRGIGFYLIADGRVSIERGGTELRQMGPGEFFGELALIDDAPRSANVVARTPVRCLVLVQWVFKPLLREHPEVTLRLLETVVERLRVHEPDTASG